MDYGNFLEPLEDYLLALAEAVNRHDGITLSKFFSFNDPHRKLLSSMVRKVQDLPSYISNRISSPWADLTLQHLLIISSRPTQNHSSITDLQIKLAQSLYSVISNYSRWILPLVYTINYDLLMLARNADYKIKNSGEVGNNLENAARTINKAFSLCCSDRTNALNVSRKWGVYNIVNLLFKLYFEIGAVNLCTNILKSLANQDLPGLDKYPKSDAVTFKYYCGVLRFFEEQFDESKQDLEFSFGKCLVHSKASFINQTFNIFD